MAAASEVQRRLPVSNRDYIGSEIYDSCYQQMQRPGPTIEHVENPRIGLLIVTGRSGVGKTEMTLQISLRLTDSCDREQPRRQYLELSFASCRDRHDLIRSIRRVAASRDTHINLPPEDPEDINHLPSLFKELFNAIQTDYPGHMKCLIFHDAEPASHLLECIDTGIYKELSIAGGNAGLWKIMVTTQNADDRKWTEKCQYINAQHFRKVDTFNLAQSMQYLMPLTELTDEQKKHLHLKMGGLPIALKVARDDIMKNMTQTTEKYLEQYYKDIDDFAVNPKLAKLSPEVRNAIATMQLGVERILYSVPLPRTLNQNPIDAQTNLAKTVITMIGLFDKKDITGDLAISCAEVALENAGVPINGGTTAVDLGNSIIYEFKQRGLCDGSGSDSINLFELVKESISLYRSKETAEEMRNILRMALIALTRLMPKDGRKHQSLTYSFMQKHAESLRKAVKEAMTHQIIEREGEPCSMLLYANLLSCIAYCQLAQRNPLQESKELLDEALNTVSLVILDKDYHSICNVGGLQYHTERARELFNLRERSGLFDNAAYGKVVANLSQYQQITKKDLGNMFPKSKDSANLRLQGHLTRSALQELKNEGKVLGEIDLKHIYLVEVMVEIYAVCTRSLKFLPNNIDRQRRENSLGSSKAAMFLCGEIRAGWEKQLLAEVILSRDILELELKEETLCVQDIVTIEREFEKLQTLDRDNVTRYGYEYGLRRTDFKDDDFNFLLCTEARAMCQGRLHEQAIRDGRYDEAEEYYKAGKKSFCSICQHRAPGFDNNQTVSKAYLKYADFLYQCSKYADSVRTVIDSMYYLHEFLHATRRNHPYPEQLNSGKFTERYEKLTKYYERWQEQPGHRQGCQTMLNVATVHDRDDKIGDALRAKYLDGFITHYKKTISNGIQADGDHRYQIMEDLIPAMPTREGAGNGGQNITVITQPTD